MPLVCGRVFWKSCGVQDLMLLSDMYCGSLLVLSLVGPEARLWHIEVILIKPDPWPGSNVSSAQSSYYSASTFHHSTLLLHHLYLRPETFRAVFTYSPSWTHL